MIQNYKNTNDEVLFGLEKSYLVDYNDVHEEANLRRAAIEAAKPKYKRGDVIEFESYGDKQRCLIATAGGKLYLICLETGNWWSLGIEMYNIDVHSFGNEVLQKIIGTGDINTVKIV